MMFTDYIRGIKNPNMKTRFEVVATTRSYDQFEQQLLNKREPFKGGLAFNVSDPSAQFNPRYERKSDLSISKNGHISAIIVPDPTVLIGYGDVKNTQDALIFIMNKEFTELEVFIARGQKKNKFNLYLLCADGELTDEMDALRKYARSRRR